MECEHAGEKCWVHLEWFCEHAGIARAFNESSQYGDAYCYALPFVVRERFTEPDKYGHQGLIEFVGVQQWPRLCQMRALLVETRRLKWGVLSTRIRDGHKRTIEVHERHTHT